ncbi:MAG: tRNA preQ1(34) S-adenosylmethionine ribosyltransferase-isomerase QueA [Ruminococcaceae bacterium]|nr:tRNA preQ1(34) S-adenosylmethionine ribosyltransferase-isomerase QueA [Oscillospiraceae bacterium]
MEVSDFYYDLPEELIAQTPIENRSESRLLVVDKITGETKHEVFKNIKEYLKPGDCLVLNDTRVIPARLYGVRPDTGSPMEFVLLKRHTDTDWEVLVRPGKRAKPGSKFDFGEGALQAEVISVNEEDGNRIVRFSWEGIFEEVLDRIGIMPLPPYIKEKLEDPERYQTVYARERGSAAAPTAGLHFTQELLQEIRDMGVDTAFVTLHVGLGTFRPVKSKTVEDHLMHEEVYSINEETCKIINDTKARGGRVIAVGTTSCRVLESVADENGKMSPKSGSTKIFIYPGYKFKVLDGLVTNFHLPESTLVMLVSALAGRENVLAAYEEAIKEKYRFFSFGDASMFI